MTSNNALVPDPDKEDILASKPFDWPLLHLGLRMCGWGDTQLKYYLMGTPVIWWGSTISLGVAFATLGVYLLRAQRKYVDMDAREFHFLFFNVLIFMGFFCRRMGPLPLCWQDRFLWLGFPFRYVLTLFVSP